jgi:tryptophanyl-tRNA synthetase
MSKSDPSDLSRINLTDDADLIAKKIRKARTDPEPLPAETSGLRSRPEAANLVGIYAALMDTTGDAVLKDFGSRQFSVFKQALVDLAVARLAPLAEEMKRLLADPAHVEDVLAKGSARAEAIAAPVYEEVKKILGFVRR